MFVGWNKYKLYHSIIMKSRNSAHIPQVVIRSFANKDSYPQTNTLDQSTFDEYMNEFDEQSSIESSSSSSSENSSDLEKSKKKIKKQIKDKLNIIEKVEINSNTTLLSSSSSPKPKEIGGYYYLEAKEAIKEINKGKSILISIDNEFFEKSVSKVTEIGISIYNPNYQQNSLFPHIINIHFIIKEFINLRNGSFVPDSKMNNITGQSIIISIKDIPNALKSIFDKLPQDSFIVGHNISGDLTSFKYLNYKIPNNFKIIDTTKLWYNFINSKNVKSSLSFILNILNIPHSFLHNGVNDSYYTLLVCLTLSSENLCKNLKLTKFKNIIEENNNSSNKEDNLEIRKAKIQKLKDEKPPSFDEFTSEVADIKLKRWERKQKKAIERLIKNEKLTKGDVFDSIKIRCSLDDKVISNKGKISTIKKFKNKNPIVNTFYKPTKYENNELNQLLNELTL